MAYVEGRIIHDADSHLMELSDCLDPYLEARLLARYRALPGFIDRAARQKAEQARAAHADATFRSGAESNILLRKNYEAQGAFIADDRPAALNALGFSTVKCFPHLACQVHQRHAQRFCLWLDAQVYFLGSGLSRQFYFIQSIDRFKIFHQLCGSSLRAFKITPLQLQRDWRTATHMRG